MNFNLKKWGEVWNVGGNGRKEKEKKLGNSKDSSGEPWGIKYSPLLFTSQIIGRNYYNVKTIIIVATWITRCYKSCQSTPAPHQYVRSNFRSFLFSKTRLRCVFYDRTQFLKMSEYLLLKPDIFIFLY